MKLSKITFASYMKFRKVMFATNIKTSITYNFCKAYESNF